MLIRVWTATTIQYHLSIERSYHVPCALESPSLFPRSLSSRWLSWHCSSSEPLPLRSPIPWWPMTSPAAAARTPWPGCWHACCSSRRRRQRGRVGPKRGRVEQNPVDEETRSVEQVVCSWFFHGFPGFVLHDFIVTSTH